MCLRLRPCFTSLAAASYAAAVGHFQVAPSCAIDGGVTEMVERALSSECDSRVYHPEAEEGGLHGPYLALWHEEGTRVEMDCS